MLLRLRPAAADDLLDLSEAVLQTNVAGNRVQLTPRVGPLISFSVTERVLRVGGAADSSLAASPQSDSLVLAITGSLLSARTADGTESWHAELPAPAAAVTLSGDQRLVLTSLEDGTVLWYSATTGQALLALAVEPKRQRWVAWTPSGYYDASPASERGEGGAERLGWELSRGPAQPPDWFRIALLRQRLQRPDLISRVLSVRDEHSALEQVNTEAGHTEPDVPLKRLLPPRVRMLTPLPGSVIVTPRLLVRYTVRSPSGEPLRETPRVVVRGSNAQFRGVILSRPARLQPGLPPDEKLYEQEVDMPAEDAQLMVQAQTLLSPGDPVLVPLRWGGSPTSAPVARPDLYVLAIGVSHYQHASLRLDYPAKDARDLAGAFQRQQGKRYGQVEVRVLTDEQARRDAIVEGLRWLRERTREKDVAAVFLAGHGNIDPVRNSYVYYPYETDPGRTDTMLGGELLRHEMGRTPGRVLLFIDTCHAGKVDLSRLTEELASNESGVVVYAASSGGQSSLESKEWGNGAFTKAVVEGLAGQADTAGSGRITVSELEHYVSERVKQLTKERQVPTSAKPGTVPDFLLATVKARYRIERKWWFWGVAGAATIGAIAGLAVGVIQSRSHSNLPTGPNVITF